MPISGPTRNRLSRSVECRAISESLLRQAANNGIDRGIPGAAVDEALDDPAAGVDSEAEEHLRAAWPIIEHIARKVAAAQDRR